MTKGKRWNGPPFVRPSLIVSKNPSRRKVLRTDGNQWQGLSPWGASCALPGASAPHAVCGQWPLDPVWTCRAKPQRRRTYWLCCPSPAWKAEEEEANLPLVLQDLLQKGVTAKGWPEKHKCPKNPLKCLYVIRKMLWTMVCKSQVSLWTAKRHFKVAELSWRKGVIYT